MKDMYSLKQVPSETQIRKFMRRVLFGKNVFCPRCRYREVWKDKERYWCPRCRRRFSLLSYTWLHDLKLPLQSFWLVLWCWTTAIPVKQAIALTNLSENAIRRWYDRFLGNICLKTPDFRACCAARRGLRQRLDAIDG
jgi:transposase-like protein